MIAGQGGAIGLENTGPPILATSIYQLVEQLISIPAKGSVLVFDQDGGIGSKAIAMGPYSRRWDHIVLALTRNLKVDQTVSYAISNYG